MPALDFRERSFLPGRVNKSTPGGVGSSGCLAPTYTNTTWKLIASGDPLSERKVLTAASR